MDKANYINCFKGKFFSITWDKDKPYGCNALGFKSKRLPSIEVYKSSGQKCMLFIAKV
jgi:hypothetical protein